MTGFAVQPEALAATAVGVAGSADALRAELARLRAAGDQLFGGAWRGPAADGFFVAWREWQRGASEVVDALGAMSSAVGAAGVGYATTEDRVRAAVVGTVA